MRYFSHSIESEIWRRAGDMIIPSITTLILGLAITALLSLVDWYAWRRVPARTDALESSGTRPKCAEQDAVAFMKVA
jgi:hypothetical protein